MPYKATDKLKTLTTSDIQMLEILKAISNDASIVVMDEPTSSITQKEVELLFKKIALLKAKGCAIVYISHKRMRYSALRMILRYSVTVRL